MNLPLRITILLMTMSVGFAKSAYAGCEVNTEYCIKHSDVFFVKHQRGICWVALRIPKPIQSNRDKAESLEGEVILVSAIHGSACPPEGELPNDAEPWAVLYKHCPYGAIAESVPRFSLELREYVKDPIKHSFAIRARECFQ